MENKSKLKSPEVTEEEILPATEEEDSVAIEIEEIEEDIEEVETVIMGSENMMTEDPEEILAIDQKDVSIAAKRATLPKTVNNVIYYIIFSKKTQIIQQRPKR